MSTVCEGIKRAKEILVEEGWTKHRYYDLNTGERCIVGALMAVQMDTPFDDLEASHVILRSIQVEQPMITRIAHFNDALTTNWSKVEKVLDRAIEMCEDGGHVPSPIR